MFAVEVVPPPEFIVAAKSEQRLEVAAVVLTRQRGEPALVFEMVYELVDPALFIVVHRTDPRNSEAASITLQRSRNQISDARQKIDAHAGVKTVRIGAANRKKTDVRLIPKRHKRH